MVTNLSFDFINKKVGFHFLSSTLLAFSIALLFFKGLNFGVDFIGGTTIQIQFEKKISVEVIKKKLKNTQFEKSTVTYFGGENEILIKFKNSSNNLNNDLGDEISNILKSTGNFNIRKIDMVGPKVGKELQEKGIAALTLSLLMILIYVSFRFEWKFAIASISALIHDIIITLGFISIFAIEVNLDILAALLTILGYSLNDTIIVFDRIRETLNNLKNKTTSLINVLNKAINNSLSRTLITSLTTFFVVLTLFIFGGDIIFGFSFTLLIGVIIGTYSSIFIASTFLITLDFSIPK